MPLRVGALFELDVGVAGVALLRVFATEGAEACIVCVKKHPKRPKSFVIQPLRHHGWNRPVLGAWVRGAAPRQLKRLGGTVVSRAEARAVAHPREWVAANGAKASLAARVVPRSSWSDFLSQVREQLDWEHDREAVEARDRQRDAANVNRLLAAAFGR